MKDVITTSHVQGYISVPSVCSSEQETAPNPPTPLSQRGGGAVACIPNPLVLASTSFYSQLSPLILEPFDKLHQIPPGITRPSPPTLDSILQTHPCSSKSEVPAPIVL